MEVMLGVLKKSGPPPIVRILSLWVHIRGTLFMETLIWFKPNMAIVRAHTERGEKKKHKHRATYNLSPIQATCHPQLSLRGFALEPNICRAP